VDDLRIAIDLQKWIHHSATLPFLHSLPCFKEVYNEI
jgi:hypothetical protein